MATAVAVVAAPVAGLTVANAGLRESHVIDRLVPTLSCAVPAKPRVPLLVVIVELVGATVKVAGKCRTTMGRDALIAPTAAWIDVEPLVAPAATRPVPAFTEATVPALLVQAKAGDVIVLLVESLPTAENCRVRVAVKRVSGVAEVELTVIEATT